MIFLMMKPIILPSKVRWRTYGKRNPPSKGINSIGLVLARDKIFRRVSLLSGPSMRRGPSQRGEGEGSGGSPPGLANDSLSLRALRERVRVRVKARLDSSASEFLLASPSLQPS